MFRNGKEVGELWYRSGRRVFTLNLLYLYGFPIEFQQREIIIRVSRRNGPGVDMSLYRRLPLEVAD
jgi:hypothetical protein